MKAILYYQQDNKVFDVIDHVSEVGIDFVIGEKTVKGIDNAVLSIIVVDKEIEVKTGENLPSSLIDKKEVFSKATVEDLVQELANVKIELMMLRGGNS